jgi:hypothetical protein
LVTAQLSARPLAGGNNFLRRINMKEPETLKSIIDFLESSPPGTEMKIKVWTEKYQSGMSARTRMPLPDINLHCDSSTCSGDRFFQSQDQYLYPNEEQQSLHFLNYYCRNCRRNSKIYSIIFKLEGGISATVYKIGEVPFFGQPTPTRLLTLLGAEKDYFLKGRRAENQGLGIGAFAYYRRAVENQKNQIFDEIIKVAELTKTSTDVIESLQ